MYDRTEIFKQSTALVAAVLFALIPLSRSMRRERWANALFIIVGIVGVIIVGAELLMLVHWIEPTRDVARRIEWIRMLLCGFALGIILALIVSSQLFGDYGKDRENNGTAEQ
jgi:hypothetical protein